MLYKHKPFDRCHSDHEFQPFRCKAFPQTFSDLVDVQSELEVKLLVLGALTQCAQMNFLYEFFQAMGAFERFFSGMFSRMDHEVMFSDGLIVAIVAFKHCGVCSVMAVVVVF